MKQDIHPTYFSAKVTCACGNSFEIGSTKQELKTEICSQCHPFFTGKQRAIAAKGRVEQFNARYGLS